MACVNPDGTLTPTAHKVLAALTEPRPPEEVAGIAGQPLFRVRASLRELGEAGLVAESGGMFVLTDEGRGKLP